MMKSLLAGLLAAVLMAGVAVAADISPQYTANGGVVPSVVIGCPSTDGSKTMQPCGWSTQSTYQLLGVKGGAGATSTGAAVGPVVGGSYVFACIGTIGGASLQLQVIGPDGSTWQNVGSAVTVLPSTVGVVMGSTQGSSTANARVTVTGGSPSGLYCNLS